MSESLRDKLNKEYRESETKVLDSVKPSSFVSDAEKFMISAENMGGKSILIATYEWGDAREEVHLTNAEAVRLCNWLSRHVGNHLE